MKRIVLIALCFAAMGAAVFLSYEDDQYRAALEIARQMDKP